MEASPPMLLLLDVAFSYVTNRLRHRNHVVFDGITLRLAHGRTVILGPNGAGKSTLLALGSTALTPQAGRVQLGRLDARISGDLRLIRRNLGWMPQRTRAHPGLTAREQVAYAGWLKGMSRGEAWSEAPTVLDRVGLLGEADRLAAHLSGGQLQRVGLAQLLVHKAQIWLLDEPTAGLDPSQRARFRDLLSEVSGTATIAVATHAVDDLAEQYDRVLVLDRGRLRFDGQVDEFLALAPVTSPHRAEVAYASLVGDVT